MAEQNSNDKPGELGADAPTVAVPSLDETKGADAPAVGRISEPEVWGGPEFDEQFAEEEGPKTGLAATFLPGVDATAVIALALALLGAAAYLLVSPLIQAKAAAVSWNDYVTKIANTAKQDPFTSQRLDLSYQAWGHIILGIAAILVALLVLGLWTAGSNKLWSRSVAQAALVIGLGVLIYGVLMKTGVVGGNVPSMKTITDIYNKNAAAGGTGATG